MNRASYKILLAVLLIGTVFVAVSFAANHDHHAMAGDKLVVGQQGTVLLEKPTKFGDYTLQPGEYVVQHAVEGQGHILTFVNMATWASIQAGNPSTGNAYAVKCEMEPLPTKVRKTTITTVPDGNGRRITRIEIKGENVAHTL